MIVASYHVKRSQRNSSGIRCFLPVEKCGDLYYKRELGHKKSHHIETF